MAVKNEEGNSRNSSFRIAVKAVRSRHGYYARHRDVTMRLSWSKCVLTISLSINLSKERGETGGEDLEILRSR